MSLMWYQSCNQMHGYTLLRCRSGEARGYTPGQVQDVGLNVQVGFTLAVANNFTRGSATERQMPRPTTNRISARNSFGNSSVPGIG